MYETVEEATTRLAGSYFLYRGEPVWCRDVLHNGAGKIALVCFKCPFLREELTLDMSDSDIEVRRYNLGYLNTQYGATYVSRLPAVGRYKQGLCRENTDCTQYSAERGKPEIDSLARTAGFRDMLRGTYPSFKEALERAAIEDGPQTVAFNERFAVRYDKFRKDYELLYKGDRIGFGADAFQIPGEFEYLKGVINKYGINIR